MSVTLLDLELTPARVAQMRAAAQALVDVEKALDATHSIEGNADYLAAGMSLMPAKYRAQQALLDCGLDRIAAFVLAATEAGFLP